MEALIIPTIISEHYSFSQPRKHPDSNSKHCNEKRKKSPLPPIVRHAHQPPSLPHASHKPLADGLPGLVACQRLDKYHCTGAPLMPIYMEAIYQDLYCFVCIVPHVTWGGSVIARQRCW